jgi:hypothetical protein
MNDNHLYAKAALPLPGVSRETVEMAKRIKAGQEGGLMGCDLFALLKPFFGAKNLGMATGGDGWNSDIAFIKDESGNIGYVQLYSAARYNARMIRSVIAVCRTPSKSYPINDFLKLPTINDLMGQLREEPNK